MMSNNHFEPENELIDKRTVLMNSTRYHFPLFLLLVFFFCVGNLCAHIQIFLNVICLDLFANNVYYLSSRCK